MSRRCIVIDVGKTNVKVHVVDAEMQTLFRRSRANIVIQQGIYPHYDIPGLWRWMLATLTEIASGFRIDAISITTHGATAALVHPGAGESGLVLPVMDYEFDGVALESEYDVLRPPFSETCSPALPAGLNLGRQLFWQQRHCETMFEDVRYVLPYPQYWSWRLTGIAVSEVTSWGCHTDLWAPRRRDYSSLVDHLNLRDLLPPLVSADTLIGCVTEDIVEQTGLPTDCKVFAGVHDSNASYLRYLARESNIPFTVISTGTWVVSFSSSASLDHLVETRDMLANVAINGNPVACARFMGGREFDVICQRLGADPRDGFDQSDLQCLVNEQALALPDFSGGSGPFGGRHPEIRGTASAGPALATIYCALMLDYQLDLLGGEGDLIVEGSWLNNPLLCGLLAQLRPRQQLFLSTDETGTVQGAAQLALKEVQPAPSLEVATATSLQGLNEYRMAWRKALSA